MLIQIVDTRDLGVSIYCSSKKGFYNWTTEGWEPWNPANHIQMFKPVFDSTADPTGFWKNFKQADIGLPLLTRQDVCAVFVSMEGTTPTPVAPVDVWTYPTPVPNPVGAGGFIRTGG